MADRRIARAIFTGIAFIAAVVANATAQTLTTLLNFDATNGTGPVVGLIQGTDGNLYGTTYYNGPGNYGTVFKITTGGTLTTLHGFDNTDGSEPDALIQASDGNFYGTTGVGTTKGGGTVFKITPSGTLTTLYTFCSVVKNNVCQDGRLPSPGSLIQGTDGNLYGVATQGGTSASGVGTVFKITTGGALTTLHSFCAQNGCTDGSTPSALIQAANGSLYGTTGYGGVGNFGTVFRITTSGAFTLLHSFDGSDGAEPDGLVQGTDGNFYGTTYYGGASGNCASNCGTVFKMTPSGTVTTLHSFDNTDGGYPESLPGLVQASDGNFYGTALYFGVYLSNGGTVFKITPGGILKVLHSFCSVIKNGVCEDGQQPFAGFVQHTNGKLYGVAYAGGSGNQGTVFTLSAGFGPFLKLATTSGKVGSTVGILGQGFDSASVVKFNGVTATKTVLTGTTYITATVPSGATDGRVTVTTGATTLGSIHKFIVHNSWGQGKAVPTPVAFASAAALNNRLYLVGGYSASTYSSPVTDNQIYNPATNSWASGAAMPAGIAQAAAATMNNILYVFGGTPDGTTDSNAVWAYNPATNSWSGKTAMPTARRSVAAVVENGIIYVIGGYSTAGGRLNTVEAYDPATDSWTIKAPMLTGKSEPSVGLVGTTIIAADGFNGTSANGDNEGYNSATNAWTSLKSDPNSRDAACGGAIGGLIYIAGGFPSTGNQVLTVNDAFNLAGNSWTTLASLPHSTAVAAAAVDQGQLYCLGGWGTGNGGAPPIGNVQVYQP